MTKNKIFTEIEFDYELDGVKQRVFYDQFDPEYHAVLNDNGDELGLTPRQAEEVWQAIMVNRQQREIL
jgi:hypothetical protein